MVSKNIVGGTSALLSMWSFLGFTVKYVEHSHHVPKMLTSPQSHKPQSWLSSQGYKEP